MNFIFYKNFEYSVIKILNFIEKDIIKRVNKMYYIMQQYNYVEVRLIVNID